MNNKENKQTDATTSLQQQGTEHIEKEVTTNRQQREVRKQITK